MEKKQRNSPTLSRKPLEIRSCDAASTLGAVEMPSSGIVVLNRNHQIPRRPSLFYRSSAVDWLSIQPIQAVVTSTSELLCRSFSKHITAFRALSREDDMAITVTIEEAQANLKELLHQLSPGEEIIITEQHKAVARLRGELEKPVRRPPPGLGKGSILHMSADFDEPLDEMAEYLS